MESLPFEMTMKIKRKPYPSANQKNLLVRLLEADSELRTGKFSASFTLKDSEARWLRIAQELNSMPGARKDFKEWRKTWQDIKSKVKKRDVEVRRSTSLTGGGPPPPPLSEEEEQVLLTLSEATRIGHTDSQESSVIFDDHCYHFHSGTEESQIEIANHQSSTSQQVPASRQVLTYQQVPTTTTPRKVPASEQVPTSRNVHTRSSAASRLQKSLKVAEALTKCLEDKNQIKKEYYDHCIKEMKKQTEAFMKQANAATMQAEALAQIARCMTARMNDVQGL